MSNNRCNHIHSVSGIPAQPNKNLDKVLYFKVVMTSRDEAINAIKGRELDPGQIAVARYYIGYSDQTVPATWTGIRMVMGIGGTSYSEDDKLYIFDDSNFNFILKNAAGEDVNMSLEEAVQYLLFNVIQPNNPSVPSDPSSPSQPSLTEAQVRAIVIDEISKQIPSYLTNINSRIDGLDRRISEIDSRITTEHANYSRDIDELREKIENANFDIDLSKYATISYVESRLSSLNIDELKSNINALDSNIDILDKKIQNIENSFNLYDSSLSELSSNIINLEGSLESLSTNIDEKLSTLEDSIDSSLAEISNNIDEKVSEVLDVVETIANDVNSKIDASYVEEYFADNVKASVNQIIEDVNIPGIVADEINNQNIEEKVSAAVDEKLENFEGVTTESLDEALQNNEYFTTQVINPIETVTEKVNNIEIQIKDLDADIDGGEEEEWNL